MPGGRRRFRAGEAFRHSRRSLAAASRRWDEIALNKATTPLDPDWNTYLALERAAALHVTTLRRDGELIGYAMDVGSLQDTIVSWGKGITK